MLTLMQQVETHNERGGEAAAPSEQQILNTLKSIAAYLLWMHDETDDIARSAVQDACSRFMNATRYVQVSFAHAYDYAEKWHCAHQVLRAEQWRIRRAIGDALDKVTGY